MHHPSSRIAGTLLAIGLVLCASGCDLAWSDGERLLADDQAVPAAAAGAARDGGKDDGDAARAAARTRTVAASDVSAAEATAKRSTTNGSGAAMLMGDLPGWTQVYAEDFDTDVAVGQWPGPYGSSIDAYPDGTPDTRGEQGGRGTYAPSDVLSVSDGVLRKHLRTEDGVAKVAAILPIIDGQGDGFAGQRYGRYAVRFRADALEGYKLAWMLWPTSDDWDNGEIDFPEGHLVDTMDAFVHPADIGAPEDSTWYGTDVAFTDWHTAVIEWEPGSVTFYLDGEQVGHHTQHVPHEPMRWTLQTETSLDFDPAEHVAGDVEIDWMAVWEQG